MPDETVLWRYTDLAKFIWTIANQKLYLTRADCLGDAFEGSVPQAYHQAQMDGLARAAFDSPEGWIHLPKPRVLFAEFREALEKEIAPHISAHRIAYLRSSHVSCWRHGHESEAMWRLYCGPRDGIAMITTWAKLKASLSDRSTRLGRVRYIDYAADTLPTQNALEPIMHKRIAFEHEQEVRVVRWLKRETRIVIPPEREPSQPEGIMMDWDAASTLERVLVSPYASDWYCTVVQDVVSKYSPPLAGCVAQSELRADPIP